MALKSIRGWYELLYTFRFYRIFVFLNIIRRVLFILVKVKVKLVCFSINNSVIGSLLKM